MILWPSRLAVTLGTCWLGDEVNLAVQRRAFTPEKITLLASGSRQLMWEAILFDPFLHLIQPRTRQYLSPRVTFKAFRIGELCIAAGRGRL